MLMKLAQLFCLTLKKIKMTVKRAEKLLQMLQSLDLFFAEGKGLVIELDIRNDCSGVLHLYLSLILHITH